MTEKELLYVEDALEHIKMMHKKCMRYENMVKDQNLKKQFVILRLNKKPYMKNFMIYYRRIL